MLFILLVLAALIVVGTILYNRLIRSRNRVKTAWSDVDVQLRVAGFYFKLWAYKSEYISSFDPDQRQISPLIVADTPQVVESRPAGTPLWGWIGGAAFLVALCFLAVVAWFFRRSDRQFRAARELRESTTAPVESLDELGSQVRDGPDFSGLE